jgi:predicted nucleic-acid-binding Zn-ribbon protein
MSKVVGKLLTCDRCGTTEFVPYAKEKELDGGYSRVDIFEDPKEPWLLSADLGDIVEGHKFIDLCPRCRKAYFELKNNFLTKGQH